MRIRSCLPVPPVSIAFEAIRHNDSRALDQWIAARGDVNAADASGMRPLHLAAVRGNVAAIGALIAAGARVDATHARSGAQPLHMAASGGHVGAIAALIGAGASLEAIWTMNGHTPLVEATFKNNGDAAIALLDAGADATKTSIRGVGTLDFALRNPVLNRAVVLRLDAIFAKRDDAVLRSETIEGRLIHDVPQSVKTESVQRVLDLLAKQDAKLGLRRDSAFLDVLAAADRGDIEAVRRAIDADPAIVNQRGGPLGTTPLILATVAGRIDVVRLLLDRGADPSLTEVHPMGVHALFKAAIFGHAAIADMLIAAGARFNDQGTANGMTPLHDAVLQGRADVVRVLLEAGARVDIEDYTGATARQFAHDRGSDDVRAVFREFFGEGAPYANAKYTCSSSLM